MLPTFLHSARLGRAARLVVVLLAVVASSAAAQRVESISESLVRAVMPGADRFSDAAGDPPVLTAYTTGADGSESLYGYVFLTSDVPPEQFGYSGPIEALVGLRPDGSITGVRVIDYMESYMNSMGDFLRTPGFQEQFAGKHLGDPFQLWGDIEGISRVSISVRALSRGVRDSARRVAATYGGAPDVAMTTEIVDPVGLSWFELRQRGFVQRIEVTEPGEGSAGISLGWIANDRLGQYFYGEQLYERALGAAERRGGAENLLLYAVDGSRLRLFRQQGWSLEQDGVSHPIESGNVVSLGLPSGGIVSGEATMVGIILLGGEVDMARPVDFVYDLGDLGTHRIAYLSEEARVAAAEAAAAAERAAAEEAAEEAPAAGAAEGGAPAGADSDSSAGSEGAGNAGPGAAGGSAGNPGASDGVSGGGEASGAGADPAGNAGAAPDSPSGSDATAAPGAANASGSAVAEGSTADPSASAGQQEPPFDFVLTENESVFQRLVDGASWSRVAFMAFVLLLASLAFALKNEGLRWVALAVTLFGLGFMDGGFLSVSHITSGIWAGVGVYLRDLPLLMIVVFTLVTTLIWGRVFCGFLCPFGALQDLIEKVVPAGWQRPLPQAVHDKAVWIKYGVLAAVVVPPLLGSRVSIYQYVEPFGTVFFLSRDGLLWAIAGAFLVASVFVPRFYCRYACPLGASLGVLSLVSLRRIPRVEQCTLCKVCEQRCPTGAIRGPDVDFKECVRCNECEILLRERRGVCAHDMDTIRPRLVQIRRSEGVTGD